MEAIGGLFGLLISVAIVIVIFFVCRGLLLWYWKIDKIVEHLAGIEYKLGQLNQSNQPPDNTSIPSQSKIKVNPKTAFKNFEPLKDE